MFGRFFRLFLGDVSPALVLLAAMLGVTIGLTPGIYGLHIALLVIALFVNINIIVFVLFALLGKVACYAAAPLLFQAGRYAIENHRRILSMLASIPIVGVTDFSRYAVAGAVFIGPPLGMVFGIVLMLSVARFRKTWLQLEASSEQFQAWHASAWVRFLQRVLIGRRADPALVLKRRTRYIRLPGVLLAALLIGGSMYAFRSVKDEVVTDYTAQSLTNANGAQVDLSRVSLDPMAGQFSLAGLQMTDPAKPAHNRVAVNALSGKVGMLDLSRGRIVLDNVSLSDVRFGEPRTKPGLVIQSPHPPAAESFDAGRFGVSGTDASRVEGYVNDNKGLREWLQEIKQWLPSSKTELPLPPAPKTCLEYLSARAPANPTPHVMIRELKLNDVKIPVDHIGNSNVYCRNLNDAPAGAGLPVSIEFKSTQYPVSITAVGHFEREGGVVEVSADFSDYDLSKFQAKLNRNNPVQFQGGKLSGRIEGKASREMVDIAIRVRLSDMRVQTAGLGVLGLDPQVTEEAMKVLNNLETTVRLLGPLDDLRIVFDGVGLTREFRDALLRAGKAELARRADALLAGKLPTGVPSVGKIIDDPLKSGTELLGNLATQPALFKGDDKSKSQGQSKSDNTKRKVDTKPPTNTRKNNPTQSSTRKKP